MKKQLIYLISVLFCGSLHVSLVATDDDDNNDKDLTGLGIIQEKRLIFILNLTIMAKSVFPKK